MVRESYDCIIGDAPSGAIPFHRLFDVSDSLRRHVYIVGVEGTMSRRQSSAKREGLSQPEPEAAGIDVGATSHFVAVFANRAECQGRQQGSVEKSALTPVFVGYWATMPGQSVVAEGVDD